MVGGHGQLVVHVCLHAVDITVYVDGFHGDLNETFFVGNVDESGKKLVQNAYECLMKGIAIGTPPLLLLLPHTV